MDFRYAGGCSRGSTLGHRQLDLVTSMSEICKSFSDALSRCIDWVA